MTNPTSVLPENGEALEQRLREIEARLASAYAGRWALAASSNGGAILLRGPEGPARDRHPQSHLQIVPEDDAAFIAHSRSDVEFLLSALRTAREDAARARREGADDVIDLVDSHDVGQDIYHEWRYWPEKKRFGYSTLREAIDAAQTATSRNALLSTPVDPGADRPHE